MEPIVQRSTCIQRREDFGAFCNLHGLTTLAVEVGVHRGEWAAEFLAQWSGKLYVGVDPWRNLPEYDNEEISFVDRTPDLLLARNAVGKHWPRAVLLTHISGVAARLLPDEIDFVYVDANHKHAFAARDMALWWPKIRRGGVLAGHDYNGAWRNEVGRAVDEFALANRLPITLVDGPMESWYFFKP